MVRYQHWIDSLGGVALEGALHLPTAPHALPTAFWLVVAWEGDTGCSRPCVDPNGKGVPILATHTDYVHHCHQGLTAYRDPWKSGRNDTLGWGFSAFETRC